MLKDDVQLPLLSHNASSYTPCFSPSFETFDVLMIPHEKGSRGGEMVEKSVWWIDRGEC